jgi:hypothetical protein
MSLFPSLDERWAHPLSLVRYKDITSITAQPTVRRPVYLNEEPLSEAHAQTFAVFMLWGAFPHERTESVIYSYNFLSLSGPSTAELMTTYYCLILDFPNLEGQVPIIISPRNRFTIFFWVQSRTYF